MKNTTPFQSYVYKSRYSRFLHDKGRRENWDETVARYFDFFTEHLKKTCNYTLDSELRKELETAVLNFEVMPSMRGIMTAGPALERDPGAIYNCAYTVADNPKVFGEIMYTLMLGSGIGFSVERQYVNKLPTIPDQLFSSDTIITVADSRIGWAKATNELISILYAGSIPKWDLSKLRPAGAILKTFGGRSSGPEPLKRTFEFIVETFKSACGRKLTSIECHDIILVISEAIVSGGVRRSALLSLSNLSDDRMRFAKSGQWWTLTPWRSMANNTAVYNDKRPSMDTFMTEWKALYDSKSGERGIFSRYAAKNVIDRANAFRKTHFGEQARTRNTEFEFGLNPCVSGDTILEVLIDEIYHKITIENLTAYLEKNPKSIIKVKSYNIEEDRIEYNVTSFIGVTQKDAKILKITDTITEKSIKVTPDHQVWTENRGWIRADHLKSDDILKII